MFVLCYILEMSVEINKHLLLRVLPMVGLVGLETSRQANTHGFHRSFSSKNLHL